ncbi:PREDICTED: uncharacterized protein LOC109157617 [Ipomoea nil]|uniref:uncharacterized protein LOC109157617 n=1 Tax=Ipomoea nil TaxID=35883 RepID=UPI000900EEE0|nr:PREDICTED: uncharacterized protein LOC109157617 [Ipomoea nil]
MCNGEFETSWHLFVDCKISKELWRAVDFNFITSSTCSFTHWFTINMPHLSLTHLGLFITICWEIWRQRNDKIWNNKNILPAIATLNKARTFLDDWKMARDNPPGSTTSRDQEEGKWSKPQQGFLKLNVDATIDMANSKMGVGCVVRDED